MLNTTSIKTIIMIVFGTALVAILSLFAISLLSKKPSSSPTTSYTQTDTQKPKVELPENFVDTGISRLKDTITRDFVVKNVGEKTLQLRNINSSCGCTSAKIISGDQETKEYGMSKRSLEVVDIAPGAEATIRVIYRPFTMPVYGVIIREVYIDTNDPDFSKIILRMKANITK